MDKRHHKPLCLCGHLRSSHSHRQMHGIRMRGYCKMSSCSCSSFEES